MNVFAWVLLAALGAAAGTSWWAALRRQRDIERLTRTAFQVLLLALAWLLRADTVGYGRALLLPLVLGLVADWMGQGRLDGSPVGERVASVALLLSRVAYVVAFALLPASRALVWLAGATAAVLLVWGGRLALVPQSRASWRQSLPTLGYAVLLAAVPVAAWSSGSAAVAWGATVLFAGDVAMAYQRTGRTRARAHGTLVVDVLHEVAAVLLVMGMLHG